MDGCGIDFAYIWPVPRFQSIVDPSSCKMFLNLCRCFSRSNSYLKYKWRQSICWQAQTRQGPKKEQRWRQPIWFCRVINRLYFHLEGRIFVYIGSLFLNDFIDSSDWGVIAFNNAHEKCRLIQCRFCSDLEHISVGL